MTGLARRTVGGAGLLVILAALAIGGSASASTRMSSLPGRALPANLTPESTAAPDDGSGIRFEAFRSFGLALVPGEPFFLAVTRAETVPAGPLHLVEVIDATEVDLGTPPWEPGGSVNGVGQLMATLTVVGPTPGEHTYEAKFDATDTVPSITRTLVVD